MNKNRSIPLRFNMARQYMLLVIFLIVSILAVARSQEHRHVTIQGKNIGIVKAFDLIKQQAQVVIMFKDDAIDKNVAMSLNLKEVSLPQALTAICDKADLEYSIRDNYVLITPARRTTTIARVQADQPTKTVAMQQQRLIQGTVVNPDGKPLSGASVVVENTNLSTSTDNKGFFYIQIPSGKQVTLIFSFIGMEPKRLTLNAGTTTQTIGEVKMQAKQTDIEELVVTGYQQIKRKNLTGSVSSVSMEDLKMPGVTDLNKMLEGKIPDMVVGINSSEVNATPKLRIRGTSTIIGNREPLWVVDGIIITDPVSLSPDVLNDPDNVNRIGNAISGLNPQDIERIDVLKDAAATALYGTRAANGVIVVTTKRGRVGKPVIAYGAQLISRQRPRYTDRRVNLMNSQERIQFSQSLVDKKFLYPYGMPVVGYEAALSSLYGGLITESEFQSQVAKLSTMNTDWFDILTKNSISQDHSVSISGGSEATRYYVSAGYTNENDVLKDVYNRRYTVSSNLDLALSSKFLLQFNLKANMNNRRFPHESINPINFAYNTSRAIPAYNENGSLYYYKRDAGTAGYLDFNILNELENSFNTLNANGTTGTANLQYKALDWLNINAIASANIQNAQQEGYWGDQTYYVSGLRGSAYGIAPPTTSLLPYGGELSTTGTNTKNYMARLQVNIDKAFGENGDHRINAVLGTEVNTTHYESLANTERAYYLDRGRKFVSDIPSTFTSYTNWVLKNRPNILDNRQNLLSAYSTVTYSYNDYFSLNANARFDGSNQFGNRSNENLLPVWSISGLANLRSIFDINHEWNYLDNLSLKASYGQQGNMLDNQSPVLTLTRGSYSAYYNEPLSKVDKFANPGLRWEKTYSSNIGVDASLFKGRLMIGTELYHKRTDDAFMKKEISDINGYESYIVNSGEIVNKGYNINMTIVPIKNENFHWLFSGSYSKVMNRMKTAPGQDTYQLTDFLDGTAIVANQPVETFYSYRFAGLNPIDGGPLFHDWEERRSELVGLGQYDTYTRVLTPSGVRTPTATGSINNTFRYKAWRLNVGLYYSLGAKTRLFRLLGNVQNGYSSDMNFNKDLLNAWAKPGDEARTTIPALMSTSSLGYSNYTTHWSKGSSYGGVPIAENAWDMYDYSDERVVSANYLRVNSASLMYEVPKSYLEKYKLSRLAFTLGATNLYTLANKRLRGQTPTQGGFANVQLTDTPTYTFGLNINF